MKKKIGLSLVLVLALLAACSIALAVVNPAGILDFTGRISNSFTPPNAAQYIQGSDLALETDVFRAALREQYYDGRTLRLVMDITAKAEKTLLIGEDTSVFDPWQSLTCLNLADRNMEDTRKIADVAPEYAALYQAGIVVSDTDNSGIISGMGEEVFNVETGTLTHYFSIEFEDDLAERDVSFYVYAMPVRFSDGEETVVPGEQVTAEAVLSVSVAKAETGCYVSMQPVEFADAGVRIDQLKIETKPMELYATITYTITDEAAFGDMRDCLWFEFIDPDSTEESPEFQRLSIGLTGVGRLDAVGDNVYCQTETLGAKELRDSYLMRPFNAMTKERYEARVIPVQPVQ